VTPDVGAEAPPASAPAPAPVAAAAPAAALAAALSPIWSPPTRPWMPGASRARFFPASRPGVCWTVFCS